MLVAGRRKSFNSGQKRGEKGVNWKLMPDPFLGLEEIDPLPINHLGGLLRGYKKFWVWIGGWMVGKYSGWHLAAPDRVT
jgi:hypothetical protein